VRKQCRRKIYQLVDPIAHAIAGACITTKDQRDELNKNELAAIEAMRTGNGTIATWQELVNMNNICQIVARNLIGPEALVDCMMAELELKAATKRYEKTGKMLLTDVGLKSIIEVQEWHDKQRRSISRAEYERMIEKTRNKIRSRSKDVTVIQ
jgi:hypothetical protein